MHCQELSTKRDTHMNYQPRGISDPFQGPASYQSEVEAAQRS